MLFDLYAGSDASEGILAQAICVARAHCRACVCLLGAFHVTMIRSVFITITITTLLHSHRHRTPRQHRLGHRPMPRIPTIRIVRHLQPMKQRPIVHHMLHLRYLMFEGAHLCGTVQRKVGRVDRSTMLG